MKSGKEKGRSSVGVVASIALHVLFFGGCLFLDTSNLTASDPADDQVTEINQVKQTTAMTEIKS